MKSKKPREGDYWHPSYGAVRVYGDRVGWFAQRLRGNGTWGGAFCVYKKFWEELEPLNKRGEGG